MKESVSEDAPMRAQERRSSQDSQAVEAALSRTRRVRSFGRCSLVVVIIVSVVIEAAGLGLGLGFTPRRECLALRERNVTRWLSDDGAVMGAAVGQRQMISGRCRDRRGGTGRGRGESFRCGEFLDCSENA